MTGPHRCDESCVCPVHGTPLIYSPHWDDHACQDVNCRYGHGGFPVPDPLPLRNIPVPREVTRVAGCDCGGMEWHRTDCSIWDEDAARSEAALEVTRARLEDYTAALNAALHARLG